MEGESPVLRTKEDEVPRMKKMLHWMAAPKSNMWVLIIVIVVIVIVALISVFAARSGWVSEEYVDALVASLKPVPVVKVPATGGFSNYRRSSFPGQPPAPIAYEQSQSNRDYVAKPANQV